MKQHYSKKNGDSKKHCGLCGDTGHHKYMCKRLYKDFGDYPLANKRPELRDNLSLSILSNISLPGAPIFKRTIDDTRSVKQEFPKRVRALVIHQKLIINPYLMGICTTENLCIECTLIKDDYEFGDKELFTTGVLNRFIVKSDQNILVNRMSATMTLNSLTV